MLKFKSLFAIIVIGEEEDEKSEYIGYFKRPEFTSFCKYMTLSQDNLIGATLQLAKYCFVGGDRELIEDTVLLMFGAMQPLAGIIEQNYSYFVLEHLKALWHYY